MTANEVDDRPVNCARDMVARDAAVPGVGKPVRIATKRWELSRPPDVSILPQFALLRTGGQLPCGDLLLTIAATFALQTASPLSVSTGASAAEQGLPQVAEAYQPPDYTHAGRCDNQDQEDSHDRVLGMAKVGECADHD